MTTHIKKLPFPSEWIENSGLRMNTGPVISRFKLSENPPVKDILNCMSPEDESRVVI